MYMLLEIFPAGKTIFFRNAPVSIPPEASGLVARIRATERRIR